MENESAISSIPLLPCFRMLAEEQQQIVQDASCFVSYSTGEVLFRKDTPVSHVMYVQSALPENTVPGGEVATFEHYAGVGAQVRYLTISF